MYRTYIEQLLILLLRENCVSETYRKPDKTKSFESLFEFVCEYLSDNICGTISVEELCQKLNYSKAMSAEYSKKKAVCQSWNIIQN